MELSLRGCRVGVIGLGYVGLPLAVEFGKQLETVGFDINRERIGELNGEWRDVLLLERRGEGVG